MLIPLSLWIIYSGAGGDRAAVRQFTDTLPIGAIAILAFIVAVWFTAPRRLEAAADDCGGLRRVGRGARPPVRAA